MKLTNVISTGLVAIALSAVGLHAQTISAPGVANYSEGDILLSFYGTSAANDTVFDIGTLAQYQTATPGTYTVSGFDSAGLADVIANTGTLGSSIYWNVAGGNGATGELAVADSGTVLKNNATYSGLASTLDNIGFEASGSAGSGTSSNDAILADKPIYNQIGANASHNWTNGPSSQADSVTAGTTTLYLWDLNKTSLTGNGTELGYFTLNATAGTLTFTVPSAIPEPSTYAAILGAVTVGFVMLRRRFGSAGLSA